MPSLVGPAIRPLEMNTGSEVLDIDVRTIDENQFSELRAAFLERTVLVLRDQDLSPSELLEFTKRWGDPYVIPYGAAVDGFPEIRPIVNVGKTRTITEAWHSDASFLERPPAHAILAAQRLPSTGGDTIFASQYSAYAALSEGMKQLLSGLRAVHEDHVLAASQGITPADTDSCSHPVVRTHPETGKKCLFVNPLFVTRFEGMTAPESADLLRFLFAHATAPEFCYRHRWRAGDVVMWDNRSTLHYAVHDHGDEERVLYRTTVAGGRPE
jgi:taurine dioxygenase